MGLALHVPYISKEIWPFLESLESLLTQVTAGTGFSVLVKYLGC